ncbi:MAG TPA: NAD(P)/FAD-dependent oxidoreductase [Mycobacteriales bacterium]|nr:NAD(P)/FAD-dependent oxidoreductase [Mycobacteriales bacterium]
MTARAPDHEVVVVGAGFGGMGAAIELKRQGFEDILIVDRESDLGGTWHVNHYPGLAVDIPSVTYSYSFEPNPYWSRLFAPGSELKRYAVHVADKYDLHRHMRFNTSVEGARWDEDDQVWVVSLAGGETVTARFLITATGYLSQPYRPEIPGIDSYTGTVIHTSDWDDDADLDGKRIAVIGTGATGVQVIPELAKVAGELTVYQRTAIYVTAKTDFPIPKQVQRLFARVPATQKAARFVSTSLLEMLMVLGVLRYRQFRRLNERAASMAMRNMGRTIKDPELRKKLTPNYSFGCKRPTFSNTYFEAFTKPNVRLETTSIDHFEPDGIVTVDGNKTQIDVLVLATGFNLWDVNFPAFEVIGREGRNLGKWWRDNRFCAYEGVSIPLFPNFLNLASPYSYSGLSYFTTIEYQMTHMGRVFSELERRGKKTFEVTEAANSKFLDRMTDLLGDSVFYNGSCSTARSYYFNPKGEAAILRPTSTLNTRREARRFPLSDYSFA